MSTSSPGPRWRPAACPPALIPITIIDPKQIHITIIVLTPLLLLLFLSLLLFFIFVFTPPHPHGVAHAAAQQGISSDTTICQEWALHRQS